MPTRSWSPALRGLALDGIVQSATHIVNDVVTLAVLDRYPSDQAHASRLPDGVRAAMCRRLAVPAWSFGGGLQGTRAMVRAMKAEVARRLAPKGSRATISFGTRISNRARKSQRSRTPIATDAA